MQTKLFEVRDRGTFIPVLCVQMVPGEMEEMYLLRRCGYPLITGPVVLMTGIQSHPEKSTCDPYDWADRTRQTAHQYIENHWSELRTGEVIDVEFILGETTVPKISERHG